MEEQKNLNSQSNLELKEEGRRHLNTGLKIILQSQSNTNSMALAQKQEDQWNRIEGPKLNHTSD
jgi:hypothetical protein